jgi:phosphoribosylformimino-5-aminoimidazole carboxamide ribotide isomerase
LSTLLSAELKVVRIIPVIDVLDGIVVHAVRGKRREYKPISSILCSSTDPLDVALVLGSCGFDELYLADLDAISGKQSNSSLYSLVVDKTGLKLMVDAGVSDLAKAEEVLESGVSKVVIGTETLRSLDFVSEAVDRFGNKNVVISLDLLNNAVLSRFSQGDFAEPLALLSEFEKRGVEQVIVLDLARVGSGEGVDFQLLEAALAGSKIKLFVGGGVRDMRDLIELRRIGVSGVLLATALHSGKIRLEGLKSLGFFHQAH